MKPTKHCFISLHHQGTEFEFTVVQKLNQGCFPKSGCNRFRGSFFVTFLEKQKSKVQNNNTTC
jgi:hypothetical protein